MIQPPDTPLPARTQNQLARWQSRLDGLPDYAARVREAQRLWPQKNREADKTFQVVRETLRRMSGTLERCWYCGDSCADEIEHIYPKSLYPEYTFVWDNYLYACGICNSEKRDNFRIFHPADDSEIDCRRKPLDPVSAPPSGLPVILHPRRDNPHDYLTLSFDDFRIHPLPTLAPRELARARYTVDVLKLNARTALREARRNHFDSYVARLEQYHKRREAGDDETELADLVRSLLQCPHRFVWERMKRQYSQRPKLMALFAEVPEALDW